MTTTAKAPSMEPGAITRLVRKAGLPADSQRDYLHPGRVSVTTSTAQAGEVVALLTEAGYEIIQVVNYGSPRTFVTVTRVA